MPDTPEISNCASCDGIVVLCPLHDAAPALLEACKAAEEDIRLSRGSGRTQMKLLDAIRKAEGSR